MTRLTLSLAALALSATTAAAHDHWSDLDGDGLLEPDEYGIDDPTFADADLDGDGVISPSEYQLLLARSADSDIAIPEEVLGGRPGLSATGAELPGTAPDPKVIRVDR